MRLGNRVQIAIGIPDIAAELDFFTALGFQLIDRNTQPYPWAQLSDGQNLILLNQDGMRYCGLIYFSADLERLVSELEDQAVDFYWKQKGDDDSLRFAMFIDPHGVDGPGGDRNLAVNIVADAAADLHQPPAVAQTLCGKFGELAALTTDLNAALNFWQSLDFKLLHKASEPYPWAILSDGGIVIGLHQSNSSIPSPHAALTYFSGDSGRRISGIRRLGIEPDFEMRDAEGNVNEAGYTSPGGQTLYVFHGEI